MPRPRSSAPAYSHHVGSGQAVVRLNHRDYYLGSHGSSESYAKYYSLLAIYNANGKTMPSDLSPRQGDEVITIRCVTADFRQRELTRFGSNEAQHNRFSNLCDLLDQRFGDAPTTGFGPRKLESLRDGFVAKGNSRRYANTQTRNVVNIIKHGVSRELAPPSVLTALEALSPLRKGQAVDRPKRAPVTHETIQATLLEVSPIVADMLTITASAITRSQKAAESPKAVWQPQWL